MRKILAVARHEFIGTVTRLGYLLTLFGMPLFVGAVSLLSAALALDNQRTLGARRHVVGELDRIAPRHQAGQVFEAPVQGPVEHRDDVEVEHVGGQEDRRQSGRRVRAQGGAAPEGGEIGPAVGVEHGHHALDDAGALPQRVRGSLQLRVPSGEI